MIHLYRAETSHIPHYPSYRCWNQLAAIPNWHWLIPFGTSARARCGVSGWKWWYFWDQAVNLRARVITPRQAAQFCKLNLLSSHSRSGGRTIQIARSLRPSVPPRATCDLALDHLPPIGLTISTASAMITTV